MPGVVCEWRRPSRGQPGSSASRLLKARCALPWQGATPGGGTLAPSLAIGVIFERAQRVKRCNAVFFVDIRAALYPIFPEVSLGRLLLDADRATALG